MVADTQYYDLLGLDPNASEGDIKRAYRKKAMEYHPDKNPNDPAAAERFQEMAEAYETLVDPNHRAAYDQFGLDGGPTGGPGGMGADDLFAHLFGGGMRFDMGGPGGPGGRKPSKGESSIIDYDVSLEDLYNGKTAHFGIEKRVLCNICNGFGGKPKTTPKPCTKCEGRGRIFVNRSLGRGQVGVSQSLCPECSGEGTRFRDKDRCKKCKGDKTVKEKKKLEIYIEKGMSDKERIVLSGEGDQEPDVETGDVVFVLHLKPHPTLDRSGSNLLAKVHLTLSEALLGFSRILLTHLDGRGIHVESEKNKIIRPGDTIVVRGEGMPALKRSDQKGDLYIQFAVDFPTEDWLRGLDVQSLGKLLPPKKADMDPRPTIVDEVKYEATAIEEFIGDGEEGDWTDDEDGQEGGPPECTTQ